MLDITEPIDSNRIVTRTGEYVFEGNGMWFQPYIYCEWCGKKTCDHTTPILTDKTDETILDVCTDCNEELIKAGLARP